MGSEVVERLKVAYHKVAEWPENRMSEGAVESLGPGFFDLLLLRNLVPEAITLIQFQADQIDRLARERDEADHALVDKYRDPKTGSFSFPGDVAAIVRRLEAAEQQVQKLEKALGRIAVATPTNTNSRTAQDAFSWTYAVASTALNGADNEAE